MERKIYSNRVTLEEMEQAIKWVESQGYVNVKVTHSHYWKGGKYGT